MKDINAQIQKPQQVSGRETDKSIVSYLWIKTVEPKKNFLKMQTEEKKSLFSKEKNTIKKKKKKIQLESLVKISSKLLEKITASLESHSQK